MGFLGWLLVVLVVLMLIGRREEKKKQATQRGQQTGPQRPYEPTVVVVDHSYEAPDNADFRLANDPPTIIRRSYADKPEGYTELFRDVPLVGVRFEGREDNLIDFINGWDRELELIRTPVPQDPNGVMVYGRWTDRWGRPHRAELGWLPREVAAQIAKDYPNVELRASPLTMFLPRGNRIAGMRMMIWRPYKRPQKKAEA